MGKEVKVSVRVEGIVVGREKNVALQPGDIVPGTYSQLQVVRKCAELR